VNSGDWYHVENQFRSAFAYDRFADTVADAARKEGVDGVVCGHIHFAEIRDIGGLLYCNDGDWVESCTALVERLDGKLEIIQWVDDQALLDPLPALPSRSRQTVPA